MIVIGADAHKRSHTLVAVCARTGELLGDRTAAVGDGGFRQLLAWATGLDAERVWALEHCRQVSGSFERFLLEHGERVVRVSTQLMAGARKRSRQRGKSDQIDAAAVARAALAEGVDSLLATQLEGASLELRLLVDHRDRLVRSRVALNTLQWHLHDLWPRAAPAGRRAVLAQVVVAHRAAPGAVRADGAGPDRAR
jgi:transposase